MLSLQSHRSQHMPSLRNWDLPAEQSPFPTSHLRSMSPAGARSTPPPLVLQLPSFSRTQKSQSKYANLLPRRTQIEPGVWSDGRDRVLSATCPSVQAFLNSARASMRLPPASSDSVFALAALDVFYRVDDPAHWLFWNDERKYQTAEIVSRISLHRPQLIHSRVAWNGTPEYLFILSGLHGASSLPIYENKAWYPILNPSKAVSPPRIINLRKRRVQPVEQPDRCDSPEVDELESEPRPKRTRCQPNRKTHSGPCADTDQTEISEGSPIGALIIPLPETDGGSLASGLARTEKEERREETRQQRGKKERMGVVPITETETGTRVQENSVNRTHSRNRSTSEASSQTVVNDRNRRSESILSAITAVEMETSVNKENKVNEAVFECGEREEIPGMVTRGRANRKRTEKGKEQKEESRGSGKRSRRKVMPG